MHVLQKVVIMAWKVSILHSEFRFKRDHPRGTTLLEARRGNVPLRGFSGASAGVPSRVLRGLRGAMQGLCGSLRGYARPLLHWTGSTSPLRDC